jgi:hypothetical protein
MAEKQVDSALEQLDGLWQSTEPKVRKEIPDGSYASRFLDMKLGISNNSGRSQVTSIFEVLSPEKHEGTKIYKYDGLENENGIAYFKGYAKTIGLVLPTSMPELSKAIEDFKASENFKKVWAIVVRTSNGFTNTFVNGEAE